MNRRPLLLSTLEGNYNQLGYEWSWGKNPLVNAVKTTGSAIDKYVIDPVGDAFKKLGSGVKNTVKKFIKKSVRAQIGNKGKDYFNKFSDDAITAQISAPIVVGTSALLTSTGSAVAIPVVAPMIPVLIKSAVKEIREAILSGASNLLSIDDISDRAIEANTQKGELKKIIEDYNFLLNGGTIPKQNLIPFKVFNGVVYYTNGYQLPITADGFRTQILGKFPKSVQDKVDTPNLEGYSDAQWMANYNAVNGGRYQLTQSGTIFTTPPTQAMADSFKPKRFSGAGGSFLPIALGIGALMALGG